MSCCAEHHVVSTGTTYLLGLWDSSPYLTALLVGPFLLALVLVYPALLFLTPKEKDLPSSAFKFHTPGSDATSTLPNLVEIGADDDEVQLSIVIPAFNEEERLPHMLDEALSHLNELKQEGKTLSGRLPQPIAGGQAADKCTASASQRTLQQALQKVEILVVDDGSRDTTASTVMEYAKKNDLSSILRLVKLGQNCGKGKAVRHGVLHARGALIAFCDADGATKFSDLSNLAKEMERIITPAGYGIVCGSRAHLVGTDATVKRSFVRNFLMHSFHVILSILMRPPNPVDIVRSHLPSFVTQAFTPSSTSNRRTLPVQPPIRDTQCGFKLFTRRSAQAVFPLAHIDRWIFDVELLLLAEIASYTTLRQTAAQGSGVYDGPKDGEKGADALLRLPLPISEVAVDWREVEGSKIDIVKDSIKMGVDLIVLRLNYAFGRWRRPGALPMPNADKTDSCCR